MSIVEYVLLYHDDYEVIKFSFKREAVEYVCQLQESNGAGHIRSLFADGEDLDLVELDKATIPLCIRLTHPTLEEGTKGEFAPFTPSDLRKIEKAFNKGKDKAIEDIKVQLVTHDAIRLLEDEVREKQMQLKKMKGLINGSEDK